MIPRQLFKLLRFFLMVIGTINIIMSTQFVLANEPLRIRTSDNISKILHISSDETVTINGIIYKVPAPWKGHKLKTKALTFDDFAPIPKDATWRGSDLYVLKDTAKALTLMIKQAKEDDVLLLAHSAYRSRGYQTRIFIKLMAEGRSFDDLIRYVAPPGYSEHMLGTVVDFYPSNWKFASKRDYSWLKENAAKFNFFETYPETGSEAPWEPWHWKYIPEAVSPTEPDEGQLHSNIP